MIIFADMKYRGIEYSVVQGLGRQVWKWSVSPGDNASLKGLAAIKSEAVGEAERAVTGRGRMYPGAVFELGPLPSPREGPVQ